MERITNRDLERLAARVNRELGNDPDAPLWTREPDGTNRQAAGFYYIDGAYGGVALYRTSDVGHDGYSHGVSDVFRSGHVPKRDLYNRISAFLDGIDARENT